MATSESATNRMRIAWFSHAARPPSEGMVNALGEARFVVHDWALGASAGVCDVAVIDVRGADTPVISAKELATIAKRLFIPAGTVVLAPPTVDRRARAAMRKIGDVCFLTNSYEPLLGALRERVRLASLAEETGERLKTLIALGHSFRFPNFTPSTERFSVLIAGEPSPLTLNACNAVRNWAHETVCVFSAGQVMRALDHARFDAAVFIPADENDLLLALARALRRHRDHRRMPVLLTAHDEGFIERLTARDSFECVLSDHLAFDLAPRVSQSARRAAMAASMRQFLKSAEGLASKSVNVANAKFFAQHALRLYQRAAETGRPISMVGLALTLKAGALEPEAVNAAILQAIKTVTRIVRAEDLIGRLTANTLVVMCAADGECANRISERLEGVVSGTTLRSILDRAEFATSVAERVEGDSVEETLARLIRDMKSGDRSSLGYS